MVQFGGWSIYFLLVDCYAFEALYLVSTLQSFMLFFSFFGMGLEKGTVATSGRLIGLGKEGKLGEVILSAFKIGGIFCIVLFLLLETLNMSAQFFEFGSAFSEGINSLCSFRHFVVLFVSLESIKWALNGVLTALKDTFFVFLSGFFSIVVFFSLPSYILIRYFPGFIQYTFGVWIVYSAISILISLLRFLRFSDRVLNS